MFKDIFFFNRQSSLFKTVGKKGGGERAIEKKKILPFLKERIPTLPGKGES